MVSLLRAQGRFALHYPSTHGGISWDALAQCLQAAGAQQSMLQLPEGPGAAAAQVQREAAALGLAGQAAVQLSQEAPEQYQLLLVFGMLGMLLMPVDL